MSFAVSNSTSRPTRALQAAGSVLNESYRNWSEHRTIRLGAALAYYGLFALVPLVSLCFFVAGMLFSTDQVQSFLTDLLTDTLDADISAQAAEIAEQLAERTTRTSLGVVGLLGLIIASSFLFVAVEDALTVIFGIERGRGTENWLRRRALSFGVVLLTTTVFVAALAVQAVTGLLESIIDAEGTLVSDLADLLGVVMSAGLGTLTLTLLLRLLTLSKVPWRYALAGSILTALGLSLGAWVLGVYYSSVGASSPVSSAASSQSYSSSTTRRRSSLPAPS